MIMVVRTETYVGLAFTHLRSHNPVRLGGIKHPSGENPTPNPLAKDKGRVNSTQR